MPKNQNNLINEYFLENRKFYLTLFHNKKRIIILNFFHKIWIDFKKSKVHDIISDISETIVAPNSQ